jgi:hypothetical protein
MPRKKPRSPANSEDEYGFLALRVNDYEAYVEAFLNRYAHSPQYAFRDTEEEPLYHFLVQLDVAATFTFPQDRAGHAFELTIYTDDHPESSSYRKLKDVQKRDEYRSPMYRAYRGRDLPVYDPPKGMGTLSKERGESRWHGTIWAQPRLLSDLLVLLGHGRPLFMDITERKIERHHWIQSVSLQTMDPAAER